MLIAGNEDLTFHSFINHQYLKFAFMFGMDSLQVKVCIKAYKNNESGVHTCNNMLKVNSLLLVFGNHECGTSIFHKH